MFFGPGHPFFGPVHVFWTWLDFFLTWGTKHVGDMPVCFLDPVCFFWGPACICAGPRDFF